MPGVLYQAFAARPGSGLKIMANCGQMPWAWAMRSRSGRVQDARRRAADLSSAVESGWRMSDNAGICNVLGSKQRQAIGALLTNGTISAAARECGVNPSTLWRWLRDADFTAALHAAEKDALSELSRRLTVASGAALDALIDVMTGPVSTPGEKTRAAQVVFDNLLRLQELSGVEARLAQLEALLGAQP